VEIAVRITCGNEAVVGSKGAECDGPDRGDAPRFRHRDVHDSWPAVALYVRDPEFGDVGREPRPVTRPIYVPMRHYSGEERLGLVLDNGRRTPALTYEFLCVCGYKVRCGVARYGDQLGGLVFIDDERSSRTRGETVRQCPGCNNMLGLPGLLP
jgi:hypothetical protein